MSILPYEGDNPDENATEVIAYFKADGEMAPFKVNPFVKRSLKTFVSNDTEMSRFVQQYNSLSAGQKDVVLRHAKGSVSEFENKNGAIAFSMIGAGATLLLVKGAEVMTWVPPVVGLAFVICGAIIAKYSPAENRHARRLEAFINELERARK